MSIEVTYDKRLRAVPADRDAYAAMVGGLRADLARLDAQGAGDPSEVFRLLRRVGFGLVVLGEYGEAVSHLERALLLAESPAALTAVRINLADAHRYAGDLDRAEPLYLEALAIAPPDMRDFALQHLAKHRIDQHRLDEAESLLREALELRRAKEDPELIASTEQALAHCRRHTENPG
ncbi:tetratricopeptide repeat protein [Streptosporangium sandarakinum]|uniref:tetratricopeptide repeat protein n=1 Tax=Streptosporangium sandarakinum TaxID=1260955 RepID=UPI0033A839C6